MMMMMIIIASLLFSQECTAIPTEDHTTSQEIDYRGRSAAFSSPPHPSPYSPKTTELLINASVASLASYESKPQEVIEGIGNLKKSFIVFFLKILVLLMEPFKNSECGSLHSAALTT